MIRTFVFASLVLAGWSLALNARHQPPQSLNLVREDGEAAVQGQALSSEALPRGTVLAGDNGLCKGHKMKLTSQKPDKKAMKCWHVNPKDGSFYEMETDADGFCKASYLAKHTSVCYDQKPEAPPGYFETSLSTAFMYNPNMYGENGTVTSEIVYGVSCAMRGYNFNRKTHPCHKHMFSVFDCRNGQKLYRDWRQEAQGVTYEERNVTRLMIECGCEDNLKVPLPLGCMVPPYDGRPVGWAGMLPQA